MSADLPDNLDLWPSDPRLLLGLSPDDADPTIAKRAYVRRIKRFKPEQFPDHFRRLRDAYEEVVSQMARDAFLRQIGVQPPGAGIEGNGDGPNSDKDASPQPSAQPARLPDSIAATYPIITDPAPSPLDAAWLAAIAGDEESAYRDLKRLAYDPAAAGDAPLRLYWLLFARPELDPQKHRCDWLLDALQRPPLASPALELYRRELEGTGNEIDSSRSREALQCELPLYALYHLALSRWQALAARGDWREILDDFPRLRRKFQFDDEVAWGRLLLAAADLALWSETSGALEVVRMCDSEVDMLHHLHVPLREHLERFDLVRETVEGWRMLGADGRVPNHWLQLIHYGWTRTLDRVYPIAAQIAAEIAADPERALGTVGILRAPLSTALTQLARELRQYGYRFGPNYEEEREEAHVRPIVEQFCVRMRWLRYDTIRRETLFFCQAELVSPEYIAQVADVMQPGIFSHEGESLAELLRADAMLDVVYAAWRGVNG